MRSLNKRKLHPLDGTKLRPKGRAFLIWDTQERGLALQVQPTGFRAFKFIYSHRGRSRWITIGPADTVSLSTARERAIALRLAVHQGQDPAGIASRSSGGNSSSTFAGIATRYLEEYAKKKNKSWKQAEWLVVRYVLPSWAEREASTITRADVRALLGKITAPTTANQVLASTSAIFTWAIRQELLAINPCKGIERNAVTSRERVLSDAEVPLFWNAFSTAGTAGTALQVLLLTGQRPGEVAHMRFEHIEDGWWTMPGSPVSALRWPGTKNAQTHRVYLSAKVQAIITGIGTATGFVFGTPPALDVTMRDICKALSVPRATPHDLRRTHGTTITGLGFGRPAMNRLQNHREGGISSVYDRHEYASENQKIMEAVATRLLSLAEGVDPATNVVPLIKSL